MKVSELLEGRVKDLWMKKYLHPDGSPKAIEAKPKVAQDPKYPRNVLTLAKRAGVDPEVVTTHYEHAKNAIDKKLPNYWALVIMATKRSLGIQ